jgi:hypothetical protein
MKRFHVWLYELCKRFRNHKKNVEVVYAQKRRIGKIQELVSFHNCNNGVAGWNLRHNRSCWYGTWIMHVQGGVYSKTLNTKQSLYRNCRGTRSFLCCKGLSRENIHIQFIYFKISLPFSFILQRVHLWYAPTILELMQSKDLKLQPFEFIWNKQCTTSDFDWAWNLKGFRADQPLLTPRNCQSQRGGQYVKARKNSRRVGSRINKAN